MIVSDRIGKILYKICWPGIWLVVRFSPPRTRVVIVANNQILLTRDWLGTGDWSLPGGGLHRGEDPRVGAVREVIEETGLYIATTDLVEMGQRTIKSSGMKIHYECFYALPATQAKPKSRSPGIAECKWVSWNEAENMPISQSAKQIIATFRQTQNLLN